MMPTPCQALGGVGGALGGPGSLWGPRDGGPAAASQGSQTGWGPSGRYITGREGSVGH